jgi:hypothetical protein
MTYEAFRRGLDVPTLTSDTVALLTMPNAVWRGKWTPGWTSFQVFSMGGKEYLFAYKVGDGTAAFDEIRDDLQNTTPVWRGARSPGFTSFQIFPVT